MTQQVPGRFTYDLYTIMRNALPVSGVYAIFSQKECVYVGESDDVCASCLEIFSEDTPCLRDSYLTYLTHFILELVPPESRVASQAERIREFEPACNLRARSPECGYYRLAQGKEQRQLMPVSSASIL